MRIKGKKISGPNVEVIVLPRGDGENIVFKAQAVLDYAYFEKLCPRPVPPRAQRPGQGWFDNIEDDDYKKKLEERSLLEQNWMCLESLKATEGLEWENVKYDDPTTWNNWREELNQSGFSPFEVARVVQGIFKANCIHEETVKEARESFLRAARQESK